MKPILWKIQFILKIMYKFTNTVWFVILKIQDIKYLNKRENILNRLPLEKNQINFIQRLKPVKLKELL